VGMIDEVNNSWASGLQIIVLVPAIWYSILLLTLIVKELKNDSYKKFPALSICYLILCGIFIFLFIKNFPSFINAGVKLVGVFPFWCRLLYSLVLLAFTVNFMKSLHTLHSLEYGKIAGKEFNITNRRKQISEFIFRLFIAALFIIMEESLALANDIEPTVHEGVIESMAHPLFQHLNSFILSVFNINSDSPNKTFTLIGTMGIVLYLFILIWWRLFIKCDYKVIGFDEDWVDKSFWQFLSGFIVCAVLWFLGNFGNSVNGLFLILLLGIASSVCLIVMIVLNECKTAKEMF
jgi:hypothetical protein